MAVSTLEQRLTPLVDTQPVWQPWGPAGRYAIEQEDTDDTSDSDSDDAGGVTRSIKRHQTWGGYTSYQLRLRFAHQLSEETAEEGSAPKDDGASKHLAHSWGQHLETEATWLSEETGLKGETSQWGSGTEGFESIVCGPSAGTCQSIWKGPTRSDAAVGCRSERHQQPFPSERTEASTAVASETRGGLFLSEHSQFFSERSQGLQQTPLPTPKATLPAMLYESAAGEYKPCDPPIAQVSCVAEELHVSEPASSSHGTALESPSSRRAKHSAATPAVTTLMVQNLPFLMSREEFLGDVDRSGFAGAYNFCHMPRFFKTGKNKGFAFLNFLSEGLAESFALEWHGRRYGFNALAKAIRVQQAAFQGIEACERIAQSKRMKRVKTGTFKPLIVFGQSAPGAVSSTQPHR